jgi:hypothetical protein
MWNLDADATADAGASKVSSPYTLYSRANKMRHKFVNKRAKMALDYSPDPSDSSEQQSDQVSWQMSQKCDH